jgi:serpin B
LNNTCTLPAFTTNAYTGTFGLNLENDDSVKSGQIRFTYDSTIGLDITGVNFTNRVKNYSKSFTKEDSDPENVEILVLFYTMKRDATILPGTGNILEFDYTTTDTACGTTALTFKELILGDSNGNALSSNAQNGNLIIAPPSEDITFDLNHVITILQYLSGIEAHDTILELDTNHNNRIGLEDLIYILLQLSDQNSQMIESFHSEKARVLSPDIQASDLESLISGNTSFALELYQRISENNKNTFLSPYSITLALAMTYAGAKNQTAQQMADTLHFMLSQEKLHPAFNYLDQELASREESAYSQDGKGFRLNIANSLWGMKGAYFVPEFMDTLALNYGAGIQMLDFMNAPESSRIVINQWVSDQTENTINNLLPEGSITPATRLVLTNAIYFNAAWESAFSENLTSPAPFYLSDNSQVMVPMMKNEAKYGYVDAEGYQAVELSYNGLKLSMLVIVPDSGLFETFESQFNEEQLNRIIRSISRKDVILRFPKFKFGSGSISLRKILSEMGMTDAFSFAADFSGISGIANLAISDVVHKAFIAVDEAGTEAAAATGVVFVETSIPQYIDVFIDRPFIFLIRDIKTSAILFMGKVVNPLN